MEINGNDDEKRETDVSDDEMSEAGEQEEHVYKVLGHDTFTNLKKIRIVPTWIKEGETFESEMNDDNNAELDFVKGLHPLLAQRVKEYLKKWYPVQKTVLPHLLAASSTCSTFPPRDLVISSPTGSGKTLCYVIPILNALRECATMNCLFALIVAPVQNLVDQIEKEFKKYNVFNVHIVSLCGSHDMNAERQQLESANIAIATPGRLMEHITDLDFPVDFTHLRYLVVDEADRMSHTARIEWLNDLEAVSNYNHNCVTIDDLYNTSFLQKILLSATLSLDVEDLHEWRLRHPRLFKAVKEDIVMSDSNLNGVIIPTTLKVEYIVCDTKFKPLVTHERIERRKSWKKILIFVNSKMASYRLAVLLKILSAGKYQVEELSSNLFGNRRQKVLARFRKGTTRVLISSDVLSRGIDVEDIDVVINYDKPLNERLLVHRVGRTARCGKKGRAVFLLSSNEVKKDFLTTLQNVSFTGKIKEKIFEGVKDAETQELYGQALAKLKEVLQNTQKGIVRKNGSFKNKRKKVAKS